MGIQIREFKESFQGCKSFALYDGFNCEFMNYQGCVIRGRDIKEYEKEHPYPKGETEYRLTDLINDFEQAGGSITFNCNHEDTAEWIKDMVYSML